YHDIIKRNPFFAFDSLLDNFFSEGNLDSHWMRCDVSETDSAFQISVDLPGVKKEQVEVNIEEGSLVIEVKETEKEEEKDCRSIRMERRQQRYGRRVFRIGKGVDEENIRAELRNGVLCIELTKKEPEQHKRKIELN
ncbi:MAG: Hsp20/alpha crystallin family protein, partial [Spirochaetota bacterium]